MSALHFIAKLTIGLTLIMLLHNCSDSTLETQKSTPPAAVLPEPTVIEGPERLYDSNIPEIYYLLSLENSSNILEELLRRGIALREAWVPVHSTPCMAPCSATAIVVRLESQDETILQMDFINEPGYYCINCGIGQYQYYSLTD